MRPDVVSITIEGEERFPCHWLAAVLYSVSRRCLRLAWQLSPAHAKEGSPDAEPSGPPPTHPLCE